MEDFGNKIIKLREYFNLSQEDLASQLGVSRQAISRWESNRGRPHGQNLEKICSKFNVKMDYFYDGAEIMFERTNDSAVREEAAIAQNAPEEETCGAEILAKNAPEEAEPKRAKTAKRRLLIASAICGILFICALAVTLRIGLPVLSSNTGDAYARLYMIESYMFYVLLSVTIVLFILGGLFLFFALRKKNVK